MGENGAGNRQPVPRLHPHHFATDVNVLWRDPDLSKVRAGKVCPSAEETRTRATP